MHVVQFHQTIKLLKINNYKFKPIKNTYNQVKNFIDIIHHLLPHPSTHHPHFLILLFTHHFSSFFCLTLASIISLLHQLINRSFGLQGTLLYIIYKDWNCPFGKHNKPINRLSTDYCFGFRLVSITYRCSAEISGVPWIILHIE